MLLPLEEAIGLSPPSSGAPCPRSGGARLPGARRPGGAVCPALVLVPRRPAVGRLRPGVPGALWLWCPAALAPGSLAAWRVGPAVPGPARRFSAPFRGPASLFHITLERTTGFEPATLTLAR